VESVKTKMKITVNCLVKNEEKFVWFAINSVLDWVDEILVWDTGSTDKTLEILQEINDPKLKVVKMGAQTDSGITLLRQQMLERSNCDWLMILDGDEIWSQQALREAKGQMSKDYSILVNPVKMLIGDIYHYQEEEAGRYAIRGRVGHYNIRFVKRNIPGLHFSEDYGSEGFRDVDNQRIQDSDAKIFFMKNPYLHASHLRRSSQDSKKYKFELGRPFPRFCLGPDLPMLLVPGVKEVGVIS